MDLYFGGAGNVVSFVVERLSDLLYEKGKLLSTRDRDDLEKIVYDLQLIKFHLRNAESVQADKVLDFRQLVAAIKRTAHEVLKIYFHGVGALGWIGRVRRNAFKNIPIIRKRAGLIDKDINDRILEIITRLVRCTVRSANWESSSSQDDISTSTGRLTRSLSFVVNEDDDFVGFEEEIKLLVGKLVGDSSDTLEKVVSLPIKTVWIHGADGMGKTSIARKIYNHPWVKRHFSAFAWVNTFSKFEHGMIMRQILLSLGAPLVRWDNELVPNLIRELQRQRCLVVFDDVGLDDYKKLEFLLENNGDSKFLFTCRLDYRAANCFSYEAKV